MVGNLQTMRIADEPNDDVAANLRTRTVSFIAQIDNLNLGRFKSFSDLTATWSCAVESHGIDDGSSPRRHKPECETRWKGKHEIWRLL